MFKRLSLLMFMSVFVIQINAASEFGRVFASPHASPVASRSASPVASAGAGAGAGAVASRSAGVLARGGLLNLIIADGARDFEIARLESEVRTRDSKIARLESEVETRDSKIARLESEVRTRDSEIETNQRDLAYHNARDGHFRELMVQRDAAVLRAETAESLAAKFTV